MANNYQVYNWWRFSPFFSCGWHVLREWPPVTVIHIVSRMRIHKQEKGKYEAVYVIVFGAKIAKIYFILPLIGLVYINDKYSFFLLLLGYKSHKNVK